jgi:hypothetical protein
MQPWQLAAQQLIQALGPVALLAAVIVWLFYDWRRHSRD